MGSFEPGKRYLMRCGWPAEVTMQLKNGRLVGKAFTIVDLEWTAEGQRVPMGGTDPCDLTHRSWNAKTETE